MKRLLQPRIAFLSIFIVCAALIGFALFLQHRMSLEPCPMCILQRYAFVSIAIVALIAAIHDPRGWALKVYCGVIGLLAVAGAGVAIRHSWVQHFPPPQQGCGVDFSMLMETLPPAKWLPLLFQGTGECSKVDWKLVGLSIPEWALVWFALTVVLVFAVAYRSPSTRR
jgi:disulfide bond formation protein DsbB